MNMVVGLTSPKHGGKDMVASQMVEYFFSDPDIHPHVLRFADPLKEMAAQLFGWNLSRLNDDFEYKETPDPAWNDITPRAALQLMGTEMFRDGPLKTEWGINIWVDYMAQRIQHYDHWDNRLLIIPDARFMDEFILVKRLGGMMVLIDPSPRIKPDIDGHSSERDMWSYGNYDFYIDSGHEKALTEFDTEHLCYIIEEKMS